MRVNTFTKFARQMPASWLPFADVASAGLPLSTSDLRFRRRVSGTRDRYAAFWGGPHEEIGTQFGCRCVNSECLIGLSRSETSWRAKLLRVLC